MHYWVEAPSLTWSSHIYWRIISQWLLGFLHECWLVLKKHKIADCFNNYISFDYNFQTTYNNTPMLNICWKKIGEGFNFDHLLFNNIKKAYIHATPPQIRIGAQYPCLVINRGGGFFYQDHINRGPVPQVLHDTGGPG